MRPAVLIPFVLGFILGVLLLLFLTTGSLRGYNRQALLQRERSLIRERMDSYREEASPIHERKVLQVENERRMLELEKELFAFELSRMK